MTRSPRYIKWEKQQSACYLLYKKENKNVYLCVSLHLHKEILKEKHQINKKGLFLRETMEEAGVEARLLFNILLEGFDL